MPDIVTFTMNPALDISTEIDRVEPTHKMRCAAARQHAGGGGINVARVFTPPWRVLRGLLPMRRRHGPHAPRSAQGGRRLSTRAPHPRRNARELFRSRNANRARIPLRPTGPDATRAGLARSHESAATHDASAWLRRGKRQFGPRHASRFLCTPRHGSSTDGSSKRRPIRLQRPPCSLHPDK